MNYVFQRCTVTELKKDLALIMDKVEAGAIYEVTRYGKPYVYILPFPLYEQMKGAKS